MERKKQEENWQQGIDAEVASNKKVDTITDSQIDIQDAQDSGKYVDTPQRVEAGSDDGRISLEEEKVRPENEQLREQLIRIQADFENYRKQVERRIENIHKMAAKQVLLEILSVADHIELALKSAQSREKNDGLLEGVELIYAEMQELLHRNGLVEIAAFGEQYDPYLHEALLKADSCESENKVIEVFQKGYLLGGQVIRHAKVKISNGPGKAGGKNEQKADTLKYRQQERADKANH